MWWHYGQTRAHEQAKTGGRAKEENARAAVLGGSLASPLVGQAAVQQLDVKLLQVKPA